MNEHGEIVICGCCGKGIRHTPDENVHYGLTPYPNDDGYGMCRECGGNPNADELKEQMGWATRHFYEARFPVVRKNLSTEERRKKWDQAPYTQKVAFVARMIEKGVMI